VPGETVAWLEGLFADLSVRAPHGITWEVDRDEPPQRLRVSLAGYGPVADLEVPDSALVSRLAVAQQVQRHVDAGWAVALPPCPDHGSGLVLGRADDELRWRCPHGDADCAVGDYQELLWPPRSEYHAGSLLGERWRRRGVRGVARWSVQNGVVQVTLHEGADEDAVRDAAAPLAVELEWIPPVGWARRQENDGETLAITNAMMWLARLDGPLRRSSSDELQVGGTPVRLSFEHHVGAPGEPLILDGDGVPFANEGDRVICAGGFAPSGPVSGDQQVFQVDQMTRRGSDA